MASEEAGLFEPRGGGLMARRTVQQIAVELEGAGVVSLHGRVEPIHADSGVSGALLSVATSDRERIEAEQFVFACGPWLDQVCPDAMAGRLFVTRQEVVYFAVERARTGPLPVWADLPYYGFPSLEGRGFKVASDTYGPALGAHLAGLVLGTERTIGRLSLDSKRAQQQGTVQ